MRKYFHSVRLEEEKCKGCTNCIKNCPTDAIRVRAGRARIIDERCIDCGECIRTCPYHAKHAVTDSLSSINAFKYKIALPAPALYGQFKNVKSVDRVVAGLKLMGFDEVFEVAKGADVVSAAVAQRLSRPHKKPVISSACPAVTRLIQVRFPNLIENIVDVIAPMEVAAILAKHDFSKKNNVPIEEIGAYFITPCPAKMTSIKEPLGLEKSNVDGAISILEVYGLLSGQLKVDKELPNNQERASAFGVGWANSEGECKAMHRDNYLAVDGIHNVIRALEDIENDRLTDLDFFEGLACTGGCVGGALTFESNFVAGNRIKTLCAQLPEVGDLSPQIPGYLENGVADATTPLESTPVMKLDDNMIKATQMMSQIEEIVQRLPGMDCGSCGSPTCRTMAEDIVRGLANENDCIFLLREKVRYLAQEMVQLATDNNREEE